MICVSSDECHLIRRRNLLQIGLHAVTLDLVEDMLDEFEDIGIDDLIDMKIHGGR